MEWYARKTRRSARVVNSRRRDFKPACSKEENGGIRKGALSVADSGRLRWCFHDGRYRRCRIPKYKRFSQRAERHEQTSIRKSDGDKAKIAKNSWQLCGMGRNVFNDRLHTGALSTEGGSLEFDNKRRCDRRYIGSEKRIASYGRQRGNRRNASRSHRRCRHTVHSFVR